MTKLTDSQLLILSRAAQRDDLAVEPPPNLKGAAAQKTYRKLLDLGLLTVVPGAPGMPTWRRDEDGRPVALVITAAGLDAIGVVPEDEQQATEPPTPRPGSEHAAPSEHCHAAVGEGAGPATTPRVGTKLTAVVQLLQREGGATIDEIVAATGWLAHTARAALTGLRKRGYRIGTERGEDRRAVYRIAGPAVGGGAQHVGKADDGEA